MATETSTDALQITDQHRTVSTDNTPGVPDGAVKSIYLSYRTNNKKGANGVVVKMFYGCNAAMIHLRAFEGTLIEMRRITAEQPDGIILAQAK